MFSYDHLAQLLRKLLDERPDNAADVFENISQQQKKCNLEHTPELVAREISERTTEFALAEIQQKLFAVWNLLLLKYSSIKCISISISIYTCVLQMIS